jgi:hypothetical protein
MANCSARAAACKSAAHPQGWVVAGPDDEIADSDIDAIGGENAIFLPST